jgi:phosphinothricin acetyltransferase
MIRFATEGDIPAILDIYSPYVQNTAYSFEYTAPTLEEFTHRFRDYTRQFPWLVWEEAGAVVGYAYASRPWGRAAYSWNAEISIYLDPQVHGKGIGRKLCAVLEQILWRQGYRILYSVITSDNEGSIAFHKKIGYTFVAEFPGCGHKFGKTLGTVWLEKRSNFVDYPHAFPLPCREIVQSDEKLQDILDTLSLS